MWLDVSGGLADCCGLEVIGISWGRLEVVLVGWQTGLGRVERFWDGLWECRRVNIWGLPVMSVIFGLIVCFLQLDSAKIICCVRV